MRRGAAAELSADVVVVGGGMAGLAVAGELERRGAAVTIVEAGPDAGPSHVSASAATSPWMEPELDPHFRRHGATGAAPHFGEWAGLRGRLGGRSLYWRGIALRVEDWALRDWPAEVAARLRGDGSDPGSYSAVEQRLGKWRSCDLGADANDAERELVGRLRALGYHDATVTPRAVQRLGRGLWRSYSPLVEVSNARVLCGSRLMELRRGERDGLLLSIVAPDGEQRVRTPALVLAAGSVASAELAATIVPLREPRAAKRFRIADHHVQGWLCAIPDGSLALEPDDEISILVRRDAASRSNLFLEATYRAGTLVLDAWAMGEQLLSDGATLDFSAPGGGAAIRVTLTEDDRSVLGAQRELLAELGERLADLGVATSGPGRATSFAEAVPLAATRIGTRAPYYAPLGTLDHESGTLALGSGLVDTTGRLDAAGRIFACGPSLFPRAGAANPALTTLCLGVLVGEAVEASL